MSDPQADFLSLRLVRYEESWLRLANARVYVVAPYDRSELDIYWIPATPLLTGTLLGFDIYRARSSQPVSSSDWVKLNTSLIVTTSYRNTGVDRSYYNFWWYRVVEVYEDDHHVQFTREVDRPVSLDSHLNGYGSDSNCLSVQQIAREWRRRKYIILNRNAELVSILFRRVAGQRCSCFNREYESPDRAADCPTCYSTGWAGGYEVLRDVLCRITPVKEQLQLEAPGLVLHTDPQAWLCDFPLVRDGDIVVRRNNWRYEIKDVNLLQTQGILTEQTFTVSKLDLTHPVQAFPL